MHIRKTIHIFFIIFLFIFTFSYAEKITVYADEDVTVTSDVHTDNSYNGGSNRNNQSGSETSGSSHSGTREEVVHLTPEQRQASADKQALRNFFGKIYDSIDQKEMIYNNNYPGQVLIGSRKMTRDELNQYNRLYDNFMNSSSKPGCSQYRGKEKIKKRVGNGNGGADPSSVTAPFRQGNSGDIANLIINNENLKKVQNKTNSPLPIDLAKYSVTGGLGGMQIVQKCLEIDNYVKTHPGGWKRTGNLSPCTFENFKRTKNTGNCACFVSIVLQECGFMGKGHTLGNCIRSNISFNPRSAKQELEKNMDFIPMNFKTASQCDLKPGDIVCFGHSTVAHTQIYAGVNGYKCFNGGGPFPSADIARSSFGYNSYPIHGVYRAKDFSSINNQSSYRARLDIIKDGIADGDSFVKNEGIYKDYQSNAMEDFITVAAITDYHFVSVDKNYYEEVNWYPKDKKQVTLRWTLESKDGKYKKEFEGQGDTVTFKNVPPGEYHVHAEQLKKTIRGTQMFYEARNYLIDVQTQTLLYYRQSISSGSNGAYVVLGKEENLEWVKTMDEDITINEKGNSVDTGIERIE